MPYDFAPTVQSLDQQIADLQARARGSSAGDNRDEMSRLINQRNSLVQGQGAAGGGNPWDTVAGARGQTFGLANDRLNALKGDPLDALVTQELQNRISGKTNPYDENTVNALKTQQAEMAAQVENNALARLRSGGGSASDPSYQSGVQEAQAARQAAAQQANLGINTQANLANYDAKTNAVGGLAGFNQGRNQAITGQSNYLSGLYGNISANHETAPANPNQGNDLANYQQWMQFFQNGGNQGNQAAGPTAQPAQVNSPYTQARQAQNARLAAKPPTAPQQSQPGQSYFPGMPEGLQGVRPQSSVNTYFPGMPTGLQGTYPQQQQFQWKPQF